jgi:DNA-binding NarL/FixJ family response regulator
MTRANSKRTELADDRVQKRESKGFQARLLVVEDNLNVRRRLIQLINKESNIGACLEASSADQAWDIVDKQQVDLVIVDVSSGRAKDIQLVEKIKLQCPTIPILILSAHDKAFSAGRTGRREGGGYIENQEARDKIIKAVRYVQSLSGSQVYGFTVLVKV